MKSSAVVSGHSGNGCDSGMMHWSLRQSLFDPSSTLQPLITQSSSFQLSKISQPRWSHEELSWAKAQPESGPKLLPSKGNISHLQHHLGAGGLGPGTASVWERQRRRHEVSGKTRSSLQCFCCTSSMRPSSRQACRGHQHDVPALGPTKTQAGAGENPGWTTGGVILPSWAAGAKFLPVFPNIYIVAILLSRLKLEMWSINMKLPVAPKSISRLWDCLGKTVPGYRGRMSRKWEICSLCSRKS